MKYLRSLIAFALVCSGVSAGPSLAHQTLLSHDAAAGEDPTAVTPAGPLQGNWHIVRTGDLADAVIMRVQIIHDGTLLEGSYVLYQPFCSMERPLPVAGTDECEFIDLGGQLASGQSRGRWASVILRPGADGLDHRIRFRTRPSSGPLAGRYYLPGDRAGTRVMLGRAPE
jgi:hypothetical protein